MSSLIRSPKKSVVEARELVLSLCKRESRPVLAGPAALAIGLYWTLSETEALLGSLVEEGTLRVTTPEENERFSIEGGYILV